MSMIYLLQSKAADNFLLPIRGRSGPITGKETQMPGKMRADKDSCPELGEGLAPQQPRVPGALPWDGPRAGRRQTCPKR